MPQLSLERSPICSSHERSTDSSPASNDAPFESRKWPCAIADDALDVVQGAMLRLARSYGQRPSEEWQPLFYRILYNGIRDAQRRRTVRSRIFALWPGSSRDSEEEPGDPYEHVADGAPEPSERLMAAEAMEKLESALGQLPARQQEAFLCVASKGSTSRPRRRRWAAPKAA